VRYPRNEDTALDVVDVRSMRRRQASQRKNVVRVVLPEASRLIAGAGSV
jgi:hypothetical protein